MSIVNVELLCDAYKSNLLFPASAVGTIQECPHCGGHVNVELPDDVGSQNIENNHEAESERQWVESARQLEVAKQHLEETTRQLEVTKQHQEETARQIEEGGRQLQTTAQLQGQIEESIANFNRFMNRCEQLLERFEKVLSKFDGQKTG
jgi:hypothetical protein